MSENKWNHKISFGSNDWCSFRAKVYADTTSQRLLLVIKGIKGDEIKISGDYMTFLRKFAEFWDTVQEAWDEICFIVQATDPKTWEEFKKWYNSKE